MPPLPPPSGANVPRAPPMILKEGALPYSKVDTSADAATTASKPPANAPLPDATKLPSKAPTATMMPPKIPAAHAQSPPKLGNYKVGSQATPPPNTIAAERPTKTVRFEIPGGSTVTTSAAPSLNAPVAGPLVWPTSRIVAAPVAISPQSNTTSQEEQQKLKVVLQNVSSNYINAWECLVGLYYQESDKEPWRYSTTGTSVNWRRNALRLDVLDQQPNIDAGQWLVPANEPFFTELLEHIRLNRWILEEAIGTWSQTADPFRVDYILEKAGWVRDGNRLPGWDTMDTIFKMEDGEERDALIAQAKLESPRFFAECEQDLFCGIRRFEKKRPSQEDDDPEFVYAFKYNVRSLRVPGTDSRVESPISAPRKRRYYNGDMNNGPGQPTQFHGVPIEERAFDNNGVRLPYALDYPDSHPNARGQKRHPEEKGAFGKNTRRKTSRTRTATPAKKENPTLDGFEQALKYDARKVAESHEANASTRQQTDGTATRQIPSHTKEPTQIVVYGYPTSRQYAAIETYERVSRGMICEDYEREPPAELKKYPQSFSVARSVHSRPLTKQEKALAFMYSGGNHWIKLTCDSAEAAARATEASPLNIQGHWVYAEIYNGKGPDVDEPIPVTEEDCRQGPFGSPRPPRKASQTLSAAFSQQAPVNKRATSTLPRSYNVPAASEAQNQHVQDIDSASPSTASSATATGVEYPSLRNRHPGQIEQSHEIAPGIPRYILRPASEALLPQPTWGERQVQWLSSQGLIPTDFIGHNLPIMENGEFDWAKASWYWRLCYWFDSHLGTDICGLKEN